MQPTGTKRLTMLLLAGFWLLAAVFYASQPVGWKLLYGEPIVLRQMLGAGLAWVLCIPLSLYCLSLPRRYPLHGTPLRRQFARLALVGAGMVLVMFLLEVLAFRLATVGAVRPPSLPKYAAMLVISHGHLYLLTYLVLAGLAYAIDYFGRTQVLEAQAARQAINAAELQRDLAAARLRTLRMQLQPHFIFNAHHAIVGLMLNGDTDKAIRMLTRLSDLLRSTLDLDEGPEVALRTELALLRQYLDIQQIRFGDRLRVEIDAPEDLFDAALPSLLLQPLVENAVHHGIDRHVAAGWIHVTVARIDGNLLLTVENSGGGTPAAGPRPQRSGIGLSTTRARLQQTYGAAHALKLIPTASGGMRVEVTIPYRTRPAAALAGVPAELSR